MSAKQPDGATHRSGEGEQQIAALSSPAPAHPSPLQALAPFALWPRFAWQGRDASPQAYRSGPPEEESHRQPIIKRRRQAGESREEDVARDEPAELSLDLEAVPEADDPSPLILYTALGVMPRTFEEAETRAMPRSGAF